MAEAKAAQFHQPTDDQKQYTKRTRAMSLTSRGEEMTGQNCRAAAKLPTLSTRLFYQRRQSTTEIRIDDGVTAHR